MSSQTLLSTSRARHARMRGTPVLDTDVQCRHCPRYFVDDDSRIDHMKEKHIEFFDKGCDGKKRFPDEASANVKITLLLTSPNHNISKNYPRRAYPCYRKGCGGWHLTSQNQRDKQRSTS